MDAFISRRSFMVSASLLAAVGARGAAHGSRLRVSGGVVRVAHL